jgi:TolB-like protein/Tfp pilus assembly protein PilF
MALDVFTFGPFAFDRRRKTLTRDGQAVAIGHRGYALLEALIEADGEPVDRQTLMERAWPGAVVEDANLTVQIATLRKALGEEGETLVITVPRIGYRLVWPRSPAGPDVAADRPIAFRGASIAVLPFANMSGDPDQEYFADGVVEEIITALSRFKQFAVVSRTSSFVFKGQAVDVREAASRLGVRYILGGSVRRAGDRLRVAAQLVDAATGADVWAERFDGAVADVFAFQDLITERVVGLIEPEIRKAEIERAWRKRPDSLEAYDLFLKAIPLVYGMEARGYIEALELLERAIDLDAGFALARAYAAWTYEKRLSLDLPRISVDDRDRCLALAREALALDRSDPVVSVVGGWVLFAVGRESRGLDMMRMALTANPNNLVGLNLGGTANLLAGDLDAASACYLRAYRLSPGAPDAFWSLTGEGWVQLERGNFEGALEWSRRSLSTFNEWSFTYLTIAAANALLGRMDEARAALAKLLELAPQTTLQASPLRYPGAWRRMKEGLRLAGLPEV